MKITKREQALLKELAAEAWDSELEVELTKLFEQFCRWADKGMSALELADKIHEFHDGVARELYKRYTGSDDATAVARAIAIGLLSEGSLGDTLHIKLARQIEFFRDLENE